MKLSELYGKPIKDVEGYVTSYFGPDVLVFKISEVVFTDDTSVFVEGEHDIPYIPGEEFTAEKLQRAREEES
jgi:hypothetical protein